MREHGVVVWTKENTAGVRFKRNSMCGSCKACGIAPGADTVVVEAKNELGAEAGDTVSVSIDTGIAFKSSVIAYCVPLLALIIGVAAGYFIGEATGFLIQAEVCAAVFGLAFCVAGFFLLRLIDKKASAKLKNVYSIDEIIEKSDETEKN